MKKMFIRCLTSLCLVCFIIGPFSSFAASNVAITTYGQVVDSLNGVTARYIPGTGNSNTGTYSCAGLVNTYYNKVFGVDVHGLVTGGTPNTAASGYSFKSVTSNITPGDIVYMTSNGHGHWALVKTISGNTITLLEQNWKWASNGQTYCTVNRVVTMGSTANLKVFKLYKNGTAVNSTSSSTSAAQASASSSNASATAVANLCFDFDFYWKMYPDLHVLGYNSSALYQHWVNYGQAEGRVASPIFDARYYLSHNPDVANAYGKTNYKMAYLHFVSFGFNEGRQGSTLYHAPTYVALYPDLKAAFGNNWLQATQHYLGHLNERRCASSSFSISAYTHYNADVGCAFINPKDVLVHYLSRVYYGPESRRCI